MKILFLLSFETDLSSEIPKIFFTKNIHYLHFDIIPIRVTDLKEGQTSLNFDQGCVLKKTQFKIETKGLLS